MKQLMVVMAVVFAGFGLSSCSNSSLKYNNKLVEAQKSLEPKFTAFGNKMSAVQEDKIADLTPDAKLLIEDVNKKVAEINALEAPKGAEDFKNSIIAQFTFVKNICEQTIKLGDTKTTSEERLTIATSMMKSEEEAKRLEDNTLKAQKAFASANGFKLELK
jgi:outer membrane murein-binding lipoprotein Lpp